MRTTHIVRFRAPGCRRRPGGTGSAAAAPPPDRPEPGPAWLPLIPALVTLLAGLYKITGPSFTRDESATLAAVHRSFPQLVRMLGHVDVVHGAYYALIWVVVRVAGSGEFALRLPSAIAMAVAAALVTVLGRRLVSCLGRAGGRTDLRVPAPGQLVRRERQGRGGADGARLRGQLLPAPRAPARMPPGAAGWSAYGVTLVALGLGNLFALLLVVAHAVTLAWSRQEYRVDRGFVLRWAAAVAATLILVSPVAVVGYSQLRQIHWIKPPSVYSLISVERLVGDTLPFVVVLVIVACAVVASVRTGGGSRRAAHWPPRLLRLALPWLLLPPAILLTASVIHPVYTFRYIVYCIPAAALLIGAALAALGRYAGPVALVVIVVAGLPSQLAERDADGHDVNIRRADRLVARYERPGMRC